MFEMIMNKYGTIIRTGIWNKLLSCSTCLLSFGMDRHSPYLMALTGAADFEQLFLNSHSFSGLIVGDFKQVLLQKVFRGRFFTA